MHYAINGGWLILQLKEVVISQVITPRFAPISSLLLILLITRELVAEE